MLYMYYAFASAAELGKRVAVLDYVASSPKGMRLD